MKIATSYEERETAAKQGRPVFLDMLKALQKGKADGVIIHKIDRSARNLKDWADLGTLIDSGVEVHFASESLDLNSRGGRLSADIQAVVASDYIRNLREEVRKGFYGRLKQGFYPMPAPLGYADAGGGEPKRVDPIQSPLIRQAFELYSSGRWGLFALADKMYDLGLRNRNGRKVTINGLATVLHNPFYLGLIRIEKLGEIFSGRHRPIIPKALFDRVQAVFAGKNVKKKEQHFFLFRRHITCAKCRNLFIAEKQKGFVYYRCHTRNCTKSTTREETIDTEVLGTFEKLRLNNSEYRYFKQATIKESGKLKDELEAGQKQIRLNQVKLKERLSKLADGYMDGVFDKETYIEKKNELLFEEQSLKEKLTNLSVSFDEAARRMDTFLELVNSAYLCYEIGKPEEKRDLVKMISSNFLANGKSVLIKLETPFKMIAERESITSGGARREAARTLKELHKKLFDYFLHNDFSSNSKSADDLACQFERKD